MKDMLEKQRIMKNEGFVNISLGGNTVEQVNSFKSSGSTVTPNRNNCLRKSEAAYLWERELLRR